MFDLGSLGSRDLEIRGTFQRRSPDGTSLENVPFSFKAKRMSTMDALEMLSSCPVSMGLVAEEILAKFQTEDMVKRRRDEHETMKRYARNCVPEEHHEILESLPYLNFLWLVDYLVRGDERVAGNKAVDELAKAMEAEFVKVGLDGKVKKNRAVAAVKGLWRMLTPASWWPSSWRPSTTN